MHQLVSAVLQTSAVSIAGLIVALLTQAFRKMGLVISSQQEAQFRYHVENAIQTVEEQGDVFITSKLQHAVELVKAKVPSKTEEAIENAIHAELSRQRSDAGNVLFKPRAS